MELLIPILIAIAVLIVAGFRIDNNTTTVILLPSEFSNAARSFTEMVSKQSETKE